MPLHGRDKISMALQMLSGSAWKRLAFSTAATSFASICNWTRVHSLYKSLFQGRKLYSG